MDPLSRSISYGLIERINVSIYVLSVIAAFAVVLAATYWTAVQSTWLAVDLAEKAKIEILLKSCRNCVATVDLRFSITVNARSTGPGIPFLL